MKLIVFILLGILIGCSTKDNQKSIAQIESSNSKLSILNLTEVDLNNIDEYSSKDDQLSFGIVNVVTDGINYMPTEKLNCDKTITSPEAAFEQLIKLKPAVKNLISCWGEYKNYYVFSINFSEEKESCFFLSIFYIKKGGDEFWYFYPHT